MNIGEKINELRRKKQITQEELANSIGVSAQAVSKWERSIANPDLFLIPTLAKFFEISTDELLGFKSMNDKPQKDKPEEVSVPRLEAKVEYLEQLLSMVMSGNADEAYENALERAKPLISFDFRSMNDADRAKWKIERGELIDGKRKMLFKATPMPRVVGKSFDPIIKNDNISLDALGVNTLSIRIRTISASRQKLTLQIFFLTEDDRVYNEAKSIKIPYTANTLCDLSVPFYNPHWKGKITGLRIDPSFEPAEYSKIEYIALLDVNGDVKYMCDFKDKSSELSEWELVNTELVDRVDGIGVCHREVDRIQSTYDPSLVLDDLDFDIGRSKHIHIRMRTDVTDNPNNYRVFLKVYFKTEASNGYYNEQRQMKAEYTAGCGIVDIYVDMSANAFWNGKLTGLRLDPVEGRAGRFEIECIEILEPTAQVRSASIIKDLENRIDELENQIDDLENQIDDLEGQICDLECRINELEE